MYDLILGIIMVITLLPFLVIAVFFLYIYTRAICDVKDENIKEAMVVRNGRDLAMDVAGAGLRELKVADAGKYQTREVVKEGEMWDVCQSERLDKAFDDKGRKFVFLAKDKGTLILRLVIKILWVFSLSAGYYFLVYMIVADLLRGFFE